MNLRQKATTPVIAALAMISAVAYLGAGPAAAKPQPITYSPVTYPLFATGFPVTPSSCATSVAPYVAALPSDADVTSAFKSAMTAALTTAPHCYSAGPSGAAQAVVSVPAGTYRLAGLTFPSNIRLEVNAAAVLQLPADRATATTTTSMINWDSGLAGSPALTNVSIVGVSQSMDAAKTAALAKGGQAIRPFNLSTDFTMNLDPATTGSTNFNPGMRLSNVRYFLIQNLFSIQNATNQSATDATVWPTSGRAVLQLLARSDSPIGGTSFLEPTHGRIENHVDVNAPRGYGPNQVNGALDVDFHDVYSQGGTTLRLETDGSTSSAGIPNRGATVNDLTADNIVGVSCNRAVSLSPHAQVNGTATVTNVWAYSCNQGVVASRDRGLAIARAGRFDNATVTNLHVDGGDTAQLDGGAFIWTVGESVMRVYQTPNLGWTPHITIASSSGHFLKIQ